MVVSTFSYQFIYFINSLSLLSILVPFRLKNRRGGPRDKVGARGIEIKAVSEAEERSSTCYLQEHLN